MQRLRQQPSCTSAHLQANIAAPWQASDMYVTCVLASVQTISLNPFKTRALSARFLLAGMTALCKAALGLSLQEQPVCHANQGVFCRNGPGTAQEQTGNAAVGATRRSHK
jgi:hypothetical protein